jgi:hypothetical protein
MYTILKNQILNSRQKKIPPGGGTMFLFSYARMLSLEQRITGIFQALGFVFFSDTAFKENEY